MVKKVSTLVMAALIAVILSFTWIVQTWAAQFTDLPTAHWANGEISELQKLGYINGYPDGSFKPENNITRAEFAAIMSRIAKDLYPEGVMFDNSRILTDINQNHWAYGAASEMLSYMSGQDAQEIFGSAFLPEKRITREEVVAIIHAIIKQHGDFSGIDINNSGFSDISSVRFAESINLCVQVGIINGYPDGSFKPNRNITRAEIAAIFVRVVEG